MLFSLQPAPAHVLVCSKKISQSPLLLVILPILWLWVNKIQIATWKPEKIDISPKDRNAVAKGL